MKNIMIDLETMGTRPDSAIVAIGAVEFDVESKLTPAPGSKDGRMTERRMPLIGRRFYEVVDLQSSMDAGLKVTGGTVYWWLQQSEAARLALCTENKKTLYAALTGFTRFWNDCDAEFIWARGTSFDVAIMKTAYDNLKLKTPFKYNADNDSRTHFRALGFTKDDEARVIQSGTAHIAVDDALWEARAVLASMTGIFI